jgi:hypothetical protein
VKKPRAVAPLPPAPAQTSLSPSPASSVTPDQKTDRPLPQQDASPLSPPAARAQTSPSPSPLSGAAPARSEKQHEIPAAGSVGSVPSHDSETISATRLPGPGFGTLDNSNNCQWLSSASPAVPVLAVALDDPTAVDLDSAEVSLGSDSLPFYPIVMDNV